MQKPFKLFSSITLATLAGLCLMSFQQSSYQGRSASTLDQQNARMQFVQNYCYAPDNNAYCPPAQPVCPPAQPSCDWNTQYTPVAPQCAPAPVCPPAPCAPAPVCAPVCPPAPCDARVVTINSDLVRITKKYPPRVDLNQEFVVELTATALDNATNVVVTETIPSAVSYTRSDNNGSASGDHVVWTFDSLRRGECKVLRLWLKPTACGEVCGCTTVTAVPYICAPIFIGCPCITCKKTGPSRVNCNDPVEFMITVSNTGTAVARDVLVTENLPAEVEHASGQRVLKFPLGDLQPNETKQICVRVKAKTRCVHICNSITTTSSNCQGSACECCLDICQSIISIRKTGPAEQYICKNADYQIVIKNEGDNVLHDVIVTDMAPNGTCIVMAPGANVSGNVASWVLKCLSPGEEKSFNLKLTTKTCGTYCNKASVRASDGCGSEAEICTTWKGCAGITVCLTDCEDPICVGSCNTYKIVVRNQGVAADKNIGITVTLTPELQPINGSGPTAATVSGQTVTFQPLCSIGPKQVAEYFVRAKSVAPGDARVVVELTAESLTKPVHEEESTMIY